MGRCCDRGSLRKEHFFADDCAVVEVIKVLEFGRSEILLGRV